MINADTLRDGIFAAKMGKRMLAKIHLEQATELNPSCVDGWVWLAWLADSPSQSIEYLEIALAKSPGHTFASQFLAVVNSLQDFGAARPVAVEPSPNSSEDFVLLQPSAEHDDETTIPALPPTEAEGSEIETSDPSWTSVVQDDIPSEEPLDGVLDDPIDDTSAAGSETEFPSPSVNVSEDSNLLRDTFTIDDADSVADLDMHILTSSPAETSPPPIQLTTAEQVVATSSVPDEHVVEINDSRQEVNYSRQLVFGPEESLRDATTDQQSEMTQSVNLVSSSVPSDLERNPDSNRTVGHDDNDRTRVILADDDSPTERDLVRSEIDVALDACDDSNLREVNPVADVDLDAHAQPSSHAEKPIQTSLAIVEEVPSTSPAADESVVEDNSARQLDFVLEESVLSATADLQDEVAESLNLAPSSVSNEVAERPDSNPTVDQNQNDNAQQVRVILAVDDSPTVRKLVSMTLEGAGYEVVTAANGIDAMKMLATTTPALILLDVNMPRMDGYKLCKLIKSHDKTKLIPVVMLSGKDGLFDKLRGRLVGCNDYISKPFESAELLRQVAKYVATPSISAAG